MLLPKLGGEQVLHALRNNALTALIPVIVLSSLPRTNENKLKKEGATAYFEKSQLELGRHSESLINIVQRTLDDVTEPHGRPVLPSEDLSSSRCVGERQT
jgi:hypothetical protein